MYVQTKRYCDIDQLAMNLSSIGKIGYNMPPSWDGGRICVPVCGQNGEYVGKVLPGRGLLLSMDAKELGIKKPIPYVLDHSPVMRAVDFFKSERKGVAVAAMMGAAVLIPNHIIRTIVTPLVGMAISTYDGIINARANGQAYDVVASKVSITTVANVWSSLWQVAGSNGTGIYTAIPGGSVHTNSTTGSWSLGIANPTGGNKAYILTIGYQAANGFNAVMLADLLVAAGAIDANLNTSQTVNSAALTRYTTGVGVQMTFDIVTALGATPANITVTYTNQGSTGSRVTAATAMLASGIVSRLTPIALGPITQLASPDYGVQSVQSIQLSAAMGSGNFALNLYFPLAFVPGVTANCYVERDSTIQIDGVVELAQSSGAVLGCLNMYALATTTVSGIVTSFIRTCQG